MDSINLDGPPMTPPETQTNIVMSPPRSVAASSPMSMASPGRLRSPTALRSPGTRSEKVSEAPRLVIRKLVLINYKSYAGVQEVGPFNTSFTAVVGPNGSGKSNVIDSLLFVFGFRAKKMRQDKLSGLIHNSEKAPDLKFARVEVHFETLGEADSEIILAREVRKDGSNFYTLNGKRATYTEVSELLEGKGIDLRHKRFLILQGEVESIALMPPKGENDGDDGLLEYLEDIIGTSEYKISLEDLSKQSEELKVDCGEKQRRVDHIYKDLKKLEADRENVETFVLNKNRSTQARSLLCQLKLHKAMSNQSVNEKELLEHKDALEQIGKRVLQKKGLMDEIDKQIALKGKNSTTLKKDLSVVTQQLKDVQLLEAKAKQQKDQLEAKRKKAEKNLAHAKTEVNQAELWLSNYSADTAALESKHKELIEREAREQKILEEIQGELHEKTKDLRGELQALQHEADPWRVEIAAVDHQLKVLNTERNEAAEKVELAQKREVECRELADKIIKNGKKNRSDLQAATDKHKSLSEELTRTLADINKTNADLKLAKDNLDRLLPELDAAKESTVNTRSRNRIEQTFKELKIPGFYGRLGSLGSIDQMYDIAVSTAAPELNNMVVDTVETAQKCIKVLRDRKLGRARFMPLDKLVAPDVSEPSSNFPASRLIDLVKPQDPALFKAFASALGNTLVVSTLQEANSVAFSGKRRHKVVTLDGGLVKVSGQMSGGGRPMRGLMNHIENVISADELDKLAKEVQKWKLAFHDAEDRLRNLTNIKEDLEIAVPREKTAVDMLQMSLNKVSEQMLTVRSERRTLEASTAKAVQTHKALLQDYEPKEDELIHKKTDLQKRSSSIEVSIKAIEDKILNAGGIRLREQKSKVDDVISEIRETQTRIDDGHANLGLKRSRHKKFVQQVTALENELKTYMDSKNTPAETTPADATNFRLQKESLMAQMEALDNEIEELKQKTTAIRNEIDADRSNEVEVGHLIEKYTQRQSETTKIIQSLQNTLNSLTLYNEAQTKALDLTTVDPDDEEMHDVDEPMLSELSPDELEGLNENELEASIHQHEKACEGKRFDAELLERYRARFREYRERKNTSDEALKSYEDVKQQYERLKNRRYSEFMSGFHQISAKLKEMYQLITMGGNAELELVDSMDPFAEGILFSVMPPKKSWRNIANLSGGEKTLSSLALVFALHHYKPTPLYVMDEIDAALDFRNVSIIANYIKERTRNGQFIVISLRNNMFELASRLVGVYKINNMTQSATIQVSAEN